MRGQVGPASPVGQVGRVGTAVVLGLALVCALAPRAWAQSTPAPTGDTAVEADPLRCWWQTSLGAVRMGEAFTLTLTCAALETESTRVIVDRSRLDPSVLALPPFDVTGGAQAADMTTSSRRFFQYVYTVRLINDLMFGQDAKIPPLTLGYKVETRSAEAGPTQGRDQTYVLPPLSVRVQSLVAGDATDVRDATRLTLADVEARRFRGRSLAMAGTVLYALAALLLVLAAVRLVAGLRTRPAGVANPIPNRAVLKSVAGELAAVARARQAEGWTEALAARAQAALRVVGAYALGRTVAQQVVADTVTAEPGELLLTSPWPKRRRVLVSAALTPAGVDAALAANPAAASRATGLRDGLAALTSARYGRGTLDESAVDAAVEQARSLAGTLAFEHWGPVKKLRQLSRFGRASAAEGEAWAR